MLLDKVLEILVIERFLDGLVKASRNMKLCWLPTRMLAMKDALTPALEINAVKQSVKNQAFIRPGSTVVSEKLFSMEMID